MKKRNIVKKIMTVGLAAMMAASAMSMSAFAKTEIPLSNGAKLVFYNSEDEMPVNENMRLANTTFSASIPVFPDNEYIKLSSGSTTLSLDRSDSGLYFSFKNKPNSSYLGIYDITEGEYITTGTNNMSGPYNFNSSFSIEDLTGSHKYKVFMGAATRACNISGTVYSY